MPGARNGGETFGPLVVRARPWRDPRGHTFPGCAPRPDGVIRDMARRPSMGELLLGGVIVALVAFVGAQVMASPRRPDREPRALTARDSAAIVSQYTRQIASRGEQYSAPGWLTHVQIARLEAAAQRDIGGRDSVPGLTADSARELVTSLETGTYLGPMLADDGDIVTRW